MFPCKIGVISYMSILLGEWCWNIPGIIFIIIFYKFLRVLLRRYSYIAFSYYQNRDVKSKKSICANRFFQRERAYGWMLGCFGSLFWELSELRLVIDMYICKEMITTSGNICHDTTEQIWTDLNIWELTEAIPNRLVA